MNLVVRSYPHLRMLEGAEVDFETVRKIIHNAYLNAFELYFVPTLDYIVNEDTECAVELFCNTTNVLTFGEFVEFPNAEEQHDLSSAEEEYTEDFRHDVDHILTVDNLCFENFQEEIINSPIVTFW
jgi:hypothetical protein